MLPPETETEEEERNAQLEVVKSHIKEIVIGKWETQPSIHKLSFVIFVDSVKEIEESDRYHTYSN